MTLRPRPARWLVAALLATLAACGPADPGPTHGPTVAPGVDLRADWRAAPITLPDLVEVAALAACDRAISPGNPDHGEDLAPVVGEARGLGLVTIVLAGHERAVVCRLTVDGGDPQVLGTTALDTVAAEVEDTEVTTAQLDIQADVGGEDRTLVIGQAGRSVVRVVADVQDQPPIEAALGDGWYAAWWPGTDAAARIVALDKAGVVLSTVETPDFPD